jgi:hypothetical protein
MALPKIACWRDKQHAAAGSTPFAASPGSHCMSESGFRFGVRRVPSLTVEIDTDGHSFRLCGPPVCIDHLTRSAGERALSLGKLSPPTAVSLTGRQASSVGVPSGAKTFAFVYPLGLTEEENSALVTGGVRTQSRRTGVTRRRTLDDTPAWLDLLLVGGFLYMDEEGELLQANALSLNLEGTQHRIFADGPHMAAASAGQALTKAGRMEAVTVESLRANGFTAFGWLNPEEEPDGHALTPRGTRSAALTHDHGAFVYCQDVGSAAAAGGAGSSSGASGEVFFYYALTRDDPWKRRRSSLSGSRDSGEKRRRGSLAAAGDAAAALDTALRNSVVNARDRVRQAHVVVNSVLKEEQRIRTLVRALTLTRALALALTLTLSPSPSPSPSFCRPRRHPDPPSNLCTASPTFPTATCVCVCVCARFVPVLLVACPLSASRPRESPSRTRRRSLRAERAASRVCSGRCLPSSHCF